MRNLAVRAAAGAVAVLVSVLFPFLLVRSWSSDLSIAPPGKTEAGALAPHLRQWRNDLVECSNEYFSRQNKGSSSGAVELQAWSERVLGPRLEKILAEIDAAQASGREASALAEAIGRFRLAIRQGSSGASTAQLAGHLRVAADLVEEFIAANQVNGYCRESAIPVRF